MWRRVKQGIFIFASATILLLATAGTAWAQPSVAAHTGTLPDGSTFLIEGTGKLERHAFPLQPRLRGSW